MYLINYKTVCPDDLITCKVDTTGYFSLKSIVKRIERNEDGQVSRKNITEFISESTFADHKYRLNNGIINETIDKISYADIWESWINNEN